MPIQCVFIFMRVALTQFTLVVSLKKVQWQQMGKVNRGKHR